MGSGKTFQNQKTALIKCYMEKRKKGVVCWSGTNKTNKKRKVEKRGEERRV